MNLDRDRSTGPPRILIVEDEPIIRRFYERFCAAQGYDPVLAPSGNIAMEILEAGRRFDVVLLDIRLPGVSGRELWKWIELNRPELCGRVIMVTADILSESTREFIRKSGRPYLEKPFSTDQLTELIEGILEAPSDRPGSNRRLGTS
ncbi:MAG: response regulator [Gemmatimonadetes bacterium]|uniref:Response regulator n=1 Tax=Candidatus Kutchimonas denitrificans TaxID=3056748 RepID=A0AAE4Z4U4_9BACT|nr:response regulator [Gemmatimonadota bacterium]NIR73790.1 response regulator [Candidatus Kutchimonas denitrificans]NIS03154.1 response regulator [Gemmatimonadota bacterium]NIT69055.1 response regulator [Gemmatimonadota bacterium]NIU54146.1 response regulator [Gemmatimonadota bacterium]